MLSFAHAVARPFVSWTTPPLLAPYGAAYGAPKIESIDPMLTILPPPLRFKCGWAACEVTNTLVRFVSMHLAPLVEAVGLGRLADVGARVVDQDVEPAETAGGFLDHRAAGRGIAHIGLHRCGLDTQPRELGGGRRVPVLIPSRDRD